MKKLIMSIMLLSSAAQAECIMPNSESWLTAAPIKDFKYKKDLVTPVQEECCRICKKGKACGDSCIPIWKDCHQPAGCACDA